ncbi:MAG TPA: glycosyltransferase family 4 protein [candidate division Zixibacteria bacterium]|nr:glycosyltransferase family 4 protein [candidate division Zixibacteria bacterium]
MDTATATEEKREQAGRGARRFHLINTIKFWGGGERFIFDLASGLWERNFDARVYGRPGRELLHRARAAGLPSFPLSMNFDYDPLPLLKFAGHSDGDVFLAMAPRDLKLLRLMTLLRTRAQLFWFLGVCYPENNLEYRWLLKNPSIRLIAASRFLQSEILGRVPQVADRITVLPAGVPIPTLEAASARRELAEKHRLSPQKLFLGMFSRLVAGKGHLMIFKALKQVRERGVDFHLWILGTGEKEGLEREAARLGLADCITFAGFQADVMPWMAGVDAVLLPSEKESFPYVVLEAMALGKTMVASNVGGVPEMIQHERDGILLPSKDPEPWASTILELAQDEQKRALLGETARRSVKEKFSPEQMIARFLEIADADSAVSRA